MIDRSKCLRRLLNIPDIVYCEVSISERESVSEKMRKGVVVCVGRGKNYTLRVDQLFPCLDWLSLTRSAV